MSKVIVMTKLDNMLIEHGFNNMSLYDRTKLITQISNESDVKHTEITEEDVLDYHKNLKKNILSQKCESNIIQGFKSSNGHTYRTNRDDQINMIGQKDALNSMGLTEVSWKTEDVGYITHTVDEWIKVYAEAFSHKQTNLAKYDSLRTKVKNANTHEEVVDVSWDELESKSI